MVELLSNFDIEEMCKYYKINLKACVSKDELVGRGVEGAYVINLDDASGRGTHWTCLFIRENSAVYFDSFGEIYPTQVKRFVGNRKLVYNCTQIQDLPQQSCGFYCLGFLYYVSKHKDVNLSALCNDFTNLFDPVDQRKNQDILRRFFQKITK